MFLPTYFLRTPESPYPSRKITSNSYFSPLRRRREGPKIVHQQIRIFDEHFMSFSRLQRDEVQELSWLNAIMRVICCYLFLFLLFRQFPKNLYGNMRTVILERIEVIEKTHGLFALVREHQLEVRERQALGVRYIRFLPSPRSVPLRCRPCPPSCRRHGEDKALPEKY